MEKDKVKDIDKLKATFTDLTSEVGKKIVGQKKVLRQILIAMLCDAHALLESYPGLGKTSMIRAISEVLGLEFNRIQNTPDLMPSDIIGTYVIEEREGKKVFKFQKGPIFANIILADEINRATPKTQAAMLEAMQEKQVTVGNQTFSLDRPFFVMATQNPIDQEGTYPLPEAQTDRFLFKILLDYPEFDNEMEIVDRYTQADDIEDLNTLLSGDSLKVLQKLTRQVPIANDIKTKAVKMVTKTRKVPDLVEYGASPRASLGLVLSAKARALLDGRKYVSLEDVEKMAYPVLRHRLVLSFEAERDGKSPDDVIEEIINMV